MNHKNKLKKLIFPILSTTLSFLMVFNLTKGLTKIANRTLADSVETPLRENKDNTATTYVSDLIIEHAESGNQAKQKIKDAGYKVFENDLNCNTGEDYVYLGYKTSNDENDAIRKISLMDEEGGYSPFDYNEFIEKQATGIDKNVEEFKAALADLKSRVASMSLAASIALDAINVFCIPQKSTYTTGPSLGEYLINPSRTDTQLKEFLLHANTIAVSNVYEYIALGTLDTDPNQSWLTKLSTNLAQNVELLDGDAEITNFVSSNEILIDIVKNNLSTFFDEYDDAVAKYNETGTITSTEESDPWDSSSNSIQQFNDDLKENNEKNAEDNIAVTIGTYKFLESFELPSSNLALWLKNLASMQDDDVHHNQIYQGFALLFNSLSAGQLLSLKGLGLETLCTYSALCFEYSNQNLSNEDQILLDECKENSSLDEIKEIVNQKKNEVLEINDGKQVSVWIGTNKDLLELNTAITTEALTSNAAANDLEILTTKNELSEKCKSALLLMGCCAGITACLAVISFCIGTLVLKCGVSGLICLGIGTMMGYVSATVCTVCFSILGIAAVAVTVLIVAAAVICALVLLVSYLIDLWDYYNPTYSEIPEVMIDRKLINDKSVYSTYYVVRDTKGEPADINAFQGHKWNALYYTKDTDIGSPLTLNSLGECFSVSYGSITSKEGEQPVCKFGQFSATNLNKDTYDYEQEKSVYLYYHTKENTTEPTNTNGKYIESVTIKCEESFKAAEDALKKEGYLAIDRDLSPDADYSTAIGFKLTNAADQAVTDIRLAIKSSSDAIYFGSSSHSYGKSADLTKTVTDEDTDFPVVLYYSKSSEVGESILSDINNDGIIEGFGFASSIKDIPEGKEAINFFSGGKAYDFNSFNEQSKGSWSNHTFVYFATEKEYTSQNSELYISGFGCISGSNDYHDDYPISKYASDLGFELYKNNNSNLSNYYDITKGSMNDEVDDVTYLLPSYTYNPKRAITEIGTFTGEPESSYLVENLVSRGFGYVSIPCYTQGDLGYYDSTWYEGKWRTIRDSHAYITKLDDEGETELEDNVICPRAFYVCGPQSGKSPLKANEIYVTNSKTDLPSNSGWNSVHELKNYYFDSYNDDGKLNNSSINLACSNKNQFYMYLKGEKVTKGSYISLISAKTNDTESNSYNQTIWNLLYEGCEEIIEDNLSSNGQSWSNKDGNISIDEDLYEDNYEDYDDEHVHSFIGICYTNKKSSALGSIKTYYVGKDEETSKSLSLALNKDGSNVTYKKCGDKIKDPYGNYFYLYSSTSGNKISHIELGRSISPWCSYLTPTDSFINDYKNTVIYTALDQNNDLLTNKYNYIYYYTNESLSYISDLTYEVSSPNNIETIASLIGNGATTIQVYNAGNGQWLYIGLTRTSSVLSSIKDIKIFSTSTSGSELGETAYINGRTYIKVSNTAINEAISNRNCNYYIYITYGIKSDKNYAIKDFYLTSNTDISNYEIATTLRNVETNVFEGLNNNSRYIVYSHKNNGVWGIYGPTAASIFNENPSLFIAVGFIAIMALSATGLYFIKKKKKISSLNI